MKNYTFSKVDTSCVKGLAVIMMLWHHLFTFPEKLNDGITFQNIYIFKNGQTLEYILGDFGKLCVAIFIMISGYGVYKSFRVTNENYTENIVRRVKNIYIKFWEVFIIFVPIGLILHSEKITNYKMDWIKNFFALETNFNGEWWFLTQYILIILMLPFLFGWLNRKKANMWTDIFYIITFNVVVYTVLFPFVGSNSYFSAFSTSYYWNKMSSAIGMVPMFLMGAYMAKYNIVEKVLQMLNNNVKIKLFGLITLWCVFELRGNWIQRCQWGWDQMDFIYAALFIVVCACLLEGIEVLKKGLNLIGKHSTGIWLTHSFFCYYYCSSIIYAPRNPILIFLFLLVVSVATDWLMVWLYDHIKRICKKIL